MNLKSKTFTDLQSKLHRGVTVIKSASPQKAKHPSKGTITNNSSSDKLGEEIRAIAAYINEELDRIEKNYQDETREYLKSMLANSVGHMVLAIDYKELQVKTVDLLFSKLGTTFEEVRQGIRRDLSWQE